ncbi:MAG: hypothetical protein ACP5KN_19980, partial [Armatimonadota bacterium]
MTRQRMMGSLGGSILALALCWAPADAFEAVVVTPDQMPPELAAADTLDEVRPFLSDANMVVHALAAERAVDVGGEEAVPTVLEVFYREPRTGGFGPQVVKVGILKALAQLEGPEITAVIAGVLTGYIGRGPDAERYIWHDGDYLSVCTAALSALAERYDDPLAFELLRAVALDNEHHAKLHCDMRTTAYEGYLLGTMSRRDTTGPAADVEYLLELLTGTGEGHMDDWVAGETGAKTQEAISNSAVIALVVQR